MFTVECPHCQLLVEIEQTNCCIFRHAIFKRTGQQVPPHAPKELCDLWKEQGLIYGCCGPFQLVRQADGEYEVQVCDYI